MEISSASEDFSDTIFWFLHENSDSSAASSCELAADVYADDDEPDESVNSSVDQKTAFWHDQEQLLVATLCRTTQTESRVRKATEDAVAEYLPVCRCRTPAVAGGCRSCSRKEIAERLSGLGFDCSVRNSKWSKSSDVPSGEHSYLEVTDQVKKKRVMVELYFRAEFEMARGGDHYNHLVSLLPEVYVGKPERLRGLVKILSVAAKRSMKESDLHVPPWRKLKYMQSKWFSSVAKPEIGKLVEETVVGGFSGEGLVRKSRASMLTFALHGRSVAVV